MGGQNSQDSTLERRSLIWNDNAVEAPDAPPSLYIDVEYKGKFYPRGCRGMIENILIYCRRTAAGRIILRYSPHPCLGPIGEVTIFPLATWSWRGIAIREMWDYDSLFIWVYDSSPDVRWGYDAEQPFDGHDSDDVGATWDDLDIRPFIRATYTGETPGDVPVSGIVNNIPIPSVSSEYQTEDVLLVPGVITWIIDIHGIGFVDLIKMRVNALANGHQTGFGIYCDDALAFYQTLPDLNAEGFTPDTPSISLTAYGANALCALLLTKRFEFRRRFQLYAINGVAAAVLRIQVHPNLLR